MPCSSAFCVAAAPTGIANSSMSCLNKLSLNAPKNCVAVMPQKERSRKRGVAPLTGLERCDLEEGLLNQCLCISLRKTGTIGKPELEPMTESIPHFGQRAVFWSSTHSLISSGENIEQQ